jgi:short-subunit dehydrogenase
MRAVLVTGASSGGSINGFIPNESDGGCAASKFAVEGYTDSLAMEMAGTGVHVAVVEPGAYKSRIRDELVGLLDELLESN